MKNIKKVLIPVLIGTIVIIVIVSLLLRNKVSYNDYVSDNIDLSNDKSNEEIVKDYNSVMDNVKSEDDVVNDEWSLVIEWDNRYTALNDYVADALLYNKYVTYSNSRFYPVGNFITEVTSYMMLNQDGDVLNVYAAKCSDNKVYIYVYKE